MATNNEQFDKIRTGLEKIAKEDQDLVEKHFGKGTSSFNTQLMIMHSTYLTGINNSLRVVCEVFGVPYEKIESGMEKALLNVYPPKTS